jgi:citrate lyase alpha subunit
MRPEMSLPVVWTEDGATAHPGRLELAGTHLRLLGGSRDVEQTRELELREIARTRLGRTSAERIGGRLTLVLELRDGSSIRVAGFERPGAMRELADRLQSALGS